MFVVTVVGKRCKPKFPCSTQSSLSWACPCPQDENQPKRIISPIFQDRASKASKTRFPYLLYWPPGALHWRVSLKTVFQADGGASCSGRA